jgi:hypothetical protein
MNMLNCKEVVKTVSSEGHPGWRRRLEVRLHLMICQHCGNYAKQLEVMKAGFKKIFSSNSRGVEESKIRELEERVLLQLRK